jgi:hypothetical protein
MQTFLPYPDFEQSIRALDFVRCRNQVRETKTLLATLVEGRKGGWSTHPACLMWKGYESALAQYGIVNCHVNRLRGWQYNSLPYFESVLAEIGQLRRPHWLGDPDLHRSHRANLCRKLPGRYEPRFGKHEPEAYCWPVWRLTEKSGQIRRSDGVWFDIIRSAGTLGKAHVAPLLRDGRTMIADLSDRSTWTMYRRPELDIPNQSDSSGS